MYINFSCTLDQNGTRDFNEVKELLKSKCIISSTFKSAEDIIFQLFVDEENSDSEESDNEISNESDSEDSDSENEEDNIYTSKYDLSNSVLIVDEAHNLINNNKLIKIIKSFPKVLLMTATPPSQMEEIVGCDTIYNYSIGDAVSNKYICDHRFYLPMIKEKVIDIVKPTELTKLDDDLCKKGLFVINGMLKTGSRKCIVYMSSIDECTKFCTTLKQIIDKYHALPYWTNSITSDVSSKQRESLLSDFQKDEYRLDTLKFLCSVRILDEGVDIIKCDSVFITKIGDNDNDIRIVQRICRANRIDKNNVNKIASCFLWCDDTNKAVAMLQLLKENDINFHKKISIINSNYDDEHKVECIEKVKECNIEFAKFIDVKCVSFQEIWNMKKNLLFEFCNENERCIKIHEKCEKYNIGEWFKTQKKKIINDDNKVYKILSKNKYVKDNLDRYIENKEMNKDNEKLSHDELKNYCLNFATKIKDIHSQENNMKE